MRVKGRTARASSSKKKKKKRKKGGQAGTPPFKATKAQRDEVEKMAGFGMRQDEMAVVIGCAERTLNTHFIKELKRGAAVADAKVGANLFRMATGGGIEASRCAIFWFKVRRRWHEVQRIIHGFDPEIVKTFVQQVVSILRRELPQKCPHCKTNLNLPKKIAGHLQKLSETMTKTLPPSEIVPLEQPGNG